MKYIKKYKLFENKNIDLIDCINSNDIWCVRDLLKDGSDPNYINYRTDSPLLIASMSDSDVSISQALIDAGADVNYKNGYDNTALSFCSNIELAKILIKAGASIEHEVDGRKVVIQRIFWEYSVQELILTMYPEKAGYLKKNTILHDDIEKKYKDLFDSAELGLL